MRLQGDVEMSDQTYLFIDGGHLDHYYIETMQKWSGTDGALDYVSIQAQLGASKCFYYNCVDDIKSDKEDDTAFHKRVASQEERFKTIQRVQNTHVRLGSMTGTRKNKRQKQVDILLAIEMLNHAARGNMSKAALVTGDQDFKPLVESLVGMGLHVTVLGDYKHTSQDLADAADYFRPLTLYTYHQWSLGKFKNAYPIPGKSIGGGEFAPENLRKTGIANGKKVEIFRYGGTSFVARIPGDEAYFLCDFPDEGRLTRFCEIEFGAEF
jgi:uncharacterized LabA/DUF88 family protein